MARTMWQARGVVGAAHMSETDRATLLRAAELMEYAANEPIYPQTYTDLLATAKALREMAK